MLLVRKTETSKMQTVFFFFYVLGIQTPKDLAE